MTAAASPNLQQTVLICDSASKDTVCDAQDVVAAGQRRHHVGLLLDDAVELAKGRQGSRSHPHNQVLIDETVVVGIRRVQLKHWLPPVHRLGGA